MCVLIHVSQQAVDKCPFRGTVAVSVCVYDARSWRPLALYKYKHIDQWKDYWLFAIRSVLLVNHLLQTDHHVSKTTQIKVRHNFLLQYPWWPQI